MDELHHRLTRARRETARRLEPLGIRPWLMPRGGFYLWCQLPEGQDSTAIARAALSENVVLAPGNVFSVSGRASRFLRFNVAQAADPRVYEVLERAMTEVMHETTSRCQEGERPCIKAI
jgi:DNA-binding transcriptional MocR family regulator